MKIGFLLPRSSVYPLIGIDFFDGFNAYIKNKAADNRFEIITDNIGFGLDEAEVYSKTEGLLLKDNADVVVAFLDGRCADMLQPLFTATGKILLLVNMGAHYFSDARSSPTTLFHTFDTAFNSRLTGKLAAGEKNLKGIMATSYYDGGYLQCYAMVTRYLQEGGAIAYNFVSHFRPEQFDMSPVAQYLDANPADDTLFCLYSGDVSPLIYRSISALQEKRKLNLYLSPMMMDESLRDVPELTVDIHNARGYTSWLSSLENESNAQYKTVFTQVTDRKPGIFGLLGWETGILLEEIQQQFAAGEKGKNIIKSILEKTFASPRGWMRIDGTTNQTYSPSYLVSCNGNLDFRVEGQIEDTAEEREKFFMERPEGYSSGWKNTYLCS